MTHELAEPKASVIRPFQEQPSPKEAPGIYTWKRILELIKVHKRELVLAHIIAVLGTLVSVPLPLLMPLLVDEVLLNQPGPAVAFINRLFPVEVQGPVLYILAVLLATMLLRLGNLVLTIWQIREFTRISKEVTFRIRRDLLAHLQKVSMSEYETLGSGAVTSRLVTDVDAVDEFIGVSVSKLLVAILSIIGTAVVLLWMHWLLALFILFLNPAVIYMTTVLGRRVKELKKKENSAYELFQQSLTETLDAIQQIRASNRENFYLKLVTDRARALKDYSLAFSWKSEGANRLSFLIFLFGFDIFRALSMFMVLFSDLSVGQMFAVYGYLWFMLSPVQEILNIQYAYNGASAALGRLNRLLGLHQEPHYPHHRDPFAGQHTNSVRLEDVCFAYGDGPPVLEHVSLHVKAGEKVALVGASGGGKTTLVHVLLGLYPPDSGRLFFDGVPVTEIGMDSVRQNVATVLQHPALLNDTMRMNLTLGQPVTDERLWQSLEVAQLKDLVMGLPQGLDTPIGRQGIRLSGGQRQRLAVARMVLSDPRVVILDEATSALDTETEAKLHASLGEFLKGRTTLIIAHRLSAVKQANRVYVFENGRIIEEGQHDELLAQDGLYARLYSQ